MASPQEKGEHDGQRAASHLTGGVRGIFAKTEELRTGINSFLDNTLQPSAHRDAQAGVTARHRDDGARVTTDTADMGHHHIDHSPTLPPRQATPTTASSTTSYPPPPSPPSNEAIAAAETTSPHLAPATTTAANTTYTTTTTAPAAAGAEPAASSEYGLKHTGYSSDAKKFGDSLKNAFHGLKKH